VGFDSWIYKLFEKWALVQFPFVATYFDGAAARETKRTSTSAAARETKRTSTSAAARETKRTSTSKGANRADETR